MNEIVPVYAQTREIMTKMGLAVVSPAAFRTQFMGHQTYQIRKFIINDKDHPTSHAKYRQVCRELWARIEAAVNNRYQYEKAEAEMALHEADIERLDGWWARLTLAPSVRAARKRLAELEVQNRRAVRAQLQLDMDQRIVRESSVLLEIHDEVAKESGEDVLKDQEAMWAAKSATEPRLKELVRGK